MAETGGAVLVVSGDVKRRERAARALWVDDPQPDLFRSRPLVRVPDAADDSILFRVVGRG